MNHKIVKHHPFFSFVAILVLVASGCSPNASQVEAPSARQEVDTVAIPDVSGATSSTAENALAALGLIGLIETESSDSFGEGLAIRTDPPYGSEVTVGSRVTIIVSSGLYRVTASDAYMEWIFVGSGEDDWPFDNPYIEDGVLVIETNPVFSRSFSWHDVTNGQGYGVASINDSFDKAVPLRIDVVDEQVEGSVPEDLLLRVPLAGIDVVPPTFLYMRLFIQKDGQYDEIRLTLTMTW